MIAALGDWLLGHIWTLLWLAFTAPAWGLSLWVVRRFWERAGRPFSRHAIPAALQALGDLRRAVERLNQQTFYLALGVLALFLPGSGAVSTLGLIFTLLLLFPQTITAYGAFLDWAEWRLSGAEDRPPEAPRNDE